MLLLQLHTTDVDDGLDWNRINLKSITEENTLDEFLSTAELAGTEFYAGMISLLSYFESMMLKLVYFLITW